MPTHPSCPPGHWAVDEEEDDDVSIFGIGSGRNEEAGREEEGNEERLRTSPN
jgi:hypothetical protein